MMAWRAAKSLLVFRQQLNEKYPGRNKASDGLIGDKAHQATPSDHNPDKNGVVKALDITHDPAHGVDIGELFHKLRESRDARISYIIANRKIMVAPYWDQPYPYEGADPHTNHIHISVTGNFDDETKWNLGDEELEMTDENYVRAFYEDLFGVVATPQQVAQYVNRPYKEVYNELRNSQPRKDFLKARQAEKERIQWLFNLAEDRKDIIQDFESRVVRGGQGKDEIIGQLEEFLKTLKEKR